MKIVSGRRRVALAAILPALLLGACGGDSVQPAPAPTPTPSPAPAPAPTPTPTPPPPAAPAGYYDSSVGMGVDANGFASLPLRSGAKRVWVNSQIGSDSNNGLTPAAPKATIAAGLALITGGAGDQLMIAEGSTFARGPGDLYAKFGHSPQCVATASWPGIDFNEIAPAPPVKLELI